MSATTAPTCALGLSADDLSAWRDHELSAAEERRITAHVANCRACQRTIIAHDALAAAIRVLKPPAPDPRNWASVRARVAAGLTVAPRTRTLRWRSAAVWSGVGAVVAVAVLAILFVSVFGQLNIHRADKVTATATPLGPLASVAPTTAVVGPSLKTVIRDAPASVVPPVGNESYENAFAFAPSDPNTGYIAATTNALNAPTTIWATHDNARTWTHVSDIPYVGGVSQYLVNVDATEPLRVSLTILSQDYTTLKVVVTNVISDDGGTTWRTVPDDIELSGLVSRGNSSFAVAYPLDAVFGGPQPIGQGRQQRIMVSHDDWKTWRPIDGPLFAQNLTVYQMWMRPGDGALLALAKPTETLPTVGPGTSQESVDATALAGYRSASETLWVSTDEGAHWNSFPTPPNLTQFMIAPSVGSHPWQVCGSASTGSGNTSKTVLGCTYNGGKTWTARPTPNVQLDCSAACSDQLAFNAIGGALLSNGTLVTEFYAVGSNPASATSEDNYVLTQDSNTWEDVGIADSLNLLLPSGANPIFNPEGGNNGSGQIVGHIGGYIPNRGEFVFAIVP